MKTNNIELVKANILTTIKEGKLEIALFESIAYCHFANIDKCFLKHEGYLFTITPAMNVKLILEEYYSYARSLEL